jgi:hypothetical protein
MPATPTKNAMCITYNDKPKDRFETRSEAVARRIRMYATGRYAPGTLGAYDCDHCDYFHVAHRRPDAATRNGSRGKSGKKGRRR